VPDSTDVATCRFFVYAAFISDVFAGCIGGWRNSASPLANCVLDDAVEHAIYYRCRDAPGGVIRHSDRGTQYRSDGLF
jgi:putative transposase